MMLLGAFGSRNAKAPRVVLKRSCKSYLAFPFTEPK